MNGKDYIKSTEFKAKLKEILNLNEYYHKYLYLNSFNDLEAEKIRVRNMFKKQPDNQMPNDCQDYLRGNDKCAFFRCCNKCS